MSDFTEVVARYREARGTGVRALARAMPCDPTHMSRVLRGVKPPGPRLARCLDKFFDANGEIIRAEETSRAPARADGLKSPVGDDVTEFAAWVTGTKISDDAISELARTAAYLAEAHTCMPAAKILPEVLGAHKAAKDYLRRGRQRLRQARELLRIDAELLAHACLLLGDLGRYEAAGLYGDAALLCAQEGRADQGRAGTAMAKTARWQDRFTEAAGLARRGFEASRHAPVRAELAYREANAIALFGDAPRARAALAEADRAAENLDDDGTTVWSFSRGRQAIFALSVDIHSGDPDSALRAADRADAYWAAGGGKIMATWAQVRAGAAIAYLLKDSLDGAVAQLRPVLELPPELRIRTVTGYLDEASIMLAGPRFAGSPVAAGLIEEIREFSFSAEANA